MTSTDVSFPQTWLYVLWRKTLALPGPAKTIERADHYEVVVPPKEPLRVGQEVRILLLSDSRYHTPELPYPPIEYDAYDLFVEGEIERVVDSEGEGATLVMKNKNTWNTIRYAYIMIPNIHDPTVFIDTRQTPRDMTQAHIYSAKTEWAKPYARVATIAPFADPLASPFVYNYDDIRDAGIEAKAREDPTGDLITNIRRRMGFRLAGVYTCAGVHSRLGKA